MGVEFKLSDRELPASPAFIRFLDRMLSGTEMGSEIWPDQVSEQLMSEREAEGRLLAEAVGRVMSTPGGRTWVARAYTLFVALLTGDRHTMAGFHDRFHFISIVGIPRSGGSYLTAELYRALGLDPHRVPGALAHDSFPEAGPSLPGAAANAGAVTLKTLAEYLTMVELFFQTGRLHSGKVVVPKKLTQCVYAAGLFLNVLGAESEYVLTVRHPVAVCVSTYEKSGGLPADGRFPVRSNIERWCRRDLEYAAWRADPFGSMDYFDVYLRYWELYHLSIVTAGLAGCARLRIAPYAAQQMQSLAQEYHDIHGSSARASSFHVSGVAAKRHPDWVAKARPALERVRSAWNVVGLPFPTDEIACCQ